MTTADNDHRTFLGMPGYGGLTPAAARGFWRSSVRPESVYFQTLEGSLLAQVFNGLWCTALNLQHAGKRINYFAMQHADVEPEDFWLDKLIAEIEARDLDVLGVAVPIKDQKGVTSLALDRPGDTWTPLCRLTMREVYDLPATFTSADVGHPLLLNTGLWVCRFDASWVTQVHFEINDRIAYDRNRGVYVAQVEPEDWYFSRLCHEMGLRIGATRKIKLTHRGEIQFANTHPWGDEFDASYVPESQINRQHNSTDGVRFPHDVDGWLSVTEGEALSDLARGKHVLEIGSYCGRSTICLAQTALSVIAVDPHDGRGTPRPKDTRSDFESNLDRYGLRERVFSCATMDEAGALIPDGGIDVAFIDGAHDIDSVQRDIDSVVPLLSRNGVLAFHDYRRFPGEHDGRWDEGVTDAVNEFLADGAELISTHDSLAVVLPRAALPLEV